VSNEFLDNLKPGDLVVIRNRRLDTWGRRTGPVVYRVQNITPKRSRFDLLSSTGTELKLSGRGYDGPAAMEPYEPKVLDEIERDNKFLRAKNRAWKMHEQLRVFEQTLTERTPEEIASFLELTKQVELFLLNHVKEKS
jgi:hypothetical protein